MAAFGAEVGLRAWGGSLGPEFLLANTPSLYDTTLFVPDPFTGLSLNPGASARIVTAEYDQVIRVNRLGMRGPDPPPRAEGERRVLVVGDSFTFAVQVAEEELFHAHLARAVGGGVTVWNGGVDSHGTPNEVRQAERLAPRLGADAVLFVFFSGNDFVDNLDYRPGVPTPVTPGAAPSDPVSRLSRASVLFMYGRMLATAGDVDGPGPGARHHLELAAFADENALGRQVQRTREALRELARTCDDLAVPCFLAVAPPAFVVYPERVEATFRLYRHDPATVDLDAPARAVLAALPPSVPGLDLAPALRAAAGETPLYYTLDGHWTPAGHRAVGEALAGWLGPLLPPP